MISYVLLCDWRKWIINFFGTRRKGHFDHTIYSILPRFSNLLRKFTNSAVGSFLLSWDTDTNKFYILNSGSKMPWKSWHFVKNAVFCSDIHKNISLQSQFVTDKHWDFPSQLKTGQYEYVCQNSFKPRVFPTGWSPLQKPKIRLSPQPEKIPR